MHELPSDADALVDRLRASLPDGQFRFLQSSWPLRLSWFPRQPSFGQEFFSGYPITDVDEPEEEEILRLEWRSEILAIMEILEQIDAQDSSFDEATPEGRVDAGLDRRVRALRIWDFYGMPLRLRKQNVFRLASPRDVFGDAVVLGVPVLDFLAAVSMKTAEDYTMIARLRRASERWRFVALTLGGLLFASLIL